MHLQTKEPSDTAMAFGGKSSEDFMRMLPFDMTGPDWRRIDKGYARTFTQKLCFKEDN
jgi:hypothetical protein